MNATQLIAVLRGIRKDHELTFKQREALAWMVARLTREEKRDTLSIVN